MELGSLLLYDHPDRLTEPLFRSNVTNGSLMVVLIDPMFLADGLPKPRAATGNIQTMEVQQKTMESQKTHENAQ